MSLNKVVIFIIIVTGLSGFLISDIPGKQSESNIPTKEIELIKQQFLAGSTDKLDQLLADGKRVFSNWIEVFNSIGFFGRSQTLLSLKNFFTNYQILTANVLPGEIKNIPPDKVLFRLDISYKKKISDQITNKNIYFLLLAREKPIETKIHHSWIIIEIKTIN